MITKKEKIMHLGMITNLFCILFAVLMLFVFAAPASATDLDETMCVSTLGGVWLSNTCTVSADHNISSGIIIDINNGITLKIADTFANPGTINVNDGGIFENLGTMYNVKNFGTININDGGIFANYRVFANHGIIANHAGGNITISSNLAMIINYADGTINNYDTITTHNYGSIMNYGHISNEAGGIFENIGSISNEAGGTFDNIGSIRNGFNIGNNLGGILTNYADGTIDNYANGHIDNFGTIINNAGGRITNNAGLITNRESGIIDNYGTITNNAGGRITNLTDGFFTNYADGTIINKCGGFITGIDETEIVQEPCDTVTSLTSSVNPSVLGQSVTFTATVSITSPGAGTLTGNVDFWSGSTLLGTRSLSGTTATFSTSALGIGSNSITTQYSGDSNFKSSTSPALSQQVNYDFMNGGGFKPPLSNTATNTVKGGRNVPIKWQLPDGNGGFISDVSVVTDVTYSEAVCSDFSTSVNPVPIDTTGKSGLHYDSATNQFIYNWQTPNTPGICYVLTLSFNDDNRYTANFKLT